MNSFLLVDTRQLGQTRGRSLQRTNYSRTGRCQNKKYCDQVPDDLRPLPHSGGGTGGTPLPSVGEGQGSQLSRKCPAPGPSSPLTIPPNAPSLSCATPALPTT